MDWENNRTQVGDLEESPGFNLAQFQQDLCKSTFEIKTEIILKQKQEKVRGKQLGGEVCGFPTHPAASSSFQTMCNTRLCCLHVGGSSLLMSEGACERFLAFYLSVGTFKSLWKSRIQR